MKYFLSFILVTALSTSLFSQTAVCGQFHRKFCVFDDAKGGSWQYNAQSKSGLFNQGMVSKLRCVIYKGMDYRISVCCETILGEKVNYKIFDGRTNEMLFDNKAAEDVQVFEFQSVSTRQLVIEVVVPQGATEKDKHKSADAACVGLLIEHKITDKQGF
ncbi:hypothetical protein [Aurantibacillus circumpalustris]|uniref:hypothetical protein n=1 Tax=Aurantibacillus circumpalustris TaxID=3036359 RepID=UPI00295B5571|nr:hypothetical protein [Aurantibacillus circumpalustris]